MNIANLSNLGLQHIKNRALEKVFFLTKIDATKPIHIYGVINERCNYKCRYCAYWRLEKYKDELSIEQWKDALISLKNFLGQFHIEFSGGEPFIKKGFVDLLEFCFKNNIQWGVTTNGSALTSPIIKRIVAANPLNINISIDSADPDVHDYARGISGSHARITRQLQWLAKAKKESGKNFPIIIKPTVHAGNLHTLESIPSWAVELGATAVNFQPIDRWTSETYDELWIENDRLSELDDLVKKLKQQKSIGLPIMNSDSNLNLWKKHFLEEKAPQNSGPCMVGFENFFIRPNGEVEMCWDFPSIGNITNQSAKEIWRGEVAKQRKTETLACDKLCLHTCLSNKSTLDKIKTALKLLK